MSTTINDMPDAAAAAVTEATRIAAQAARNGTETAKASIEAAHTYLERRARSAVTCSAPGRPRARRPSRRRSRPRMPRSMPALASSTSA